MARHTAWPAHQARPPCGFGDGRMGGQRASESKHRDGIEQTESRRQSTRELRIWNWCSPGELEACSQRRREQKGSRRRNSKPTRRAASGVRCTPRWLTGHRRRSRACWLPVLVDSVTPETDAGFRRRVAKKLFDLSTCCRKCFVCLTFKPKAIPNQHLNNSPLTNGISTRSLERPTHVLHRPAAIRARKSCSLGDAEQVDARLLEGDPTTQASE